MNQTEQQNQGVAVNSSEIFTPARGTWLEMPLSIFFPSPHLISPDNPVQLYFNLFLVLQLWN